MHLYCYPVSSMSTNYAYVVYHVTDLGAMDRLKSLHNYATVMQTRPTPMGVVHPSCSIHFPLARTCCMSIAEFSSSQPLTTHVFMGKPKSQHYTLADDVPIPFPIPCNVSL